ncbi:hypothetical protein [Kocuria nitroreducens]
MSISRAPVINGEFGGRAGVESFSGRRWVTVQEESRARFPF